MISVCVYSYIPVQSPCKNSTVAIHNRETDVHFICGLDAGGMFRTPDVHYRDCGVVKQHFSLLVTFVLLGPCLIGDFHGIREVISFTTPNVRNRGQGVVK